MKITNTLNIKIVNIFLKSEKIKDWITGTRFLYIYVYYLRLSIKKGPYRFRVGCLSSRSKKNVFEFLNDFKFILYLKYDNFSTTWCMTRLPLLPIIYVRAHYIIQLETHNNKSYFSGNTNAAVNKKNNKITCKKYTRFFLVLSLSNINISDDKSTTLLSISYI